MRDFTKYIQYIKNTGGTPKESDFIYDWEPIGEMVLMDMRAANLIYIDKDRIIHLTKPYNHALNLTKAEGRVK